MVMGPSVGVILADLGAEVIKVEPIGGDKTRKLAGAGAGYFAMFNRNKKSLCVDLKSDEGRRVVEDLVRSADVMIENFRAGALDKLGLGYEQVRKINPRIVYQSSKGFLSGPYEDRVALDEVAQMMGGLAYMTGPPGQPLRAGSSVVDITGGMFGVIGILAALLRRNMDGPEGKGTDVTSALFETTAFLVGQHIAQKAVTGVSPQPMPARVSAWAIYDKFDTADGQMFVGVVSNSQWRAFCAEFERPEWLDDAYGDNTARLAKRDELLPQIRTLFAGYGTDALEKKLQEAGLPYAPIRKPEDLVDDPHLRDAGFVDLTLPETGQPVKLPKLPLEIGGARTGLSRDLPDAGVDTDDVLGALGYDQSRIAALRQAGTVA
jgi:crotonobetainyl-CoA:carnitine CoA-transferase CaiB-like acyl-CoA transferase